jgi:hypothetical protein
MMAARKKEAVKKEDAVATIDDGAASEERKKAIQELITGDAELRQKHSLASQGICDEIEELIGRVKTITKYGQISGIDDKIQQLREAAGLSEDKDNENESAETFQKSIAKFDFGERNELLDDFLVQFNEGAEFGIPDLTKWLLSKNIKSNLSTGNVKEIFQTWGNLVSMVMDPDDPKVQKKDGRKLLFKKNG